MLTTVDLVEDWIQMRTTLQKQLKALEANKGLSGVDELDAPNRMIITRVNKMVAELTELLKAHASDSRT